MRALVVIPTYDEAATIVEVIGVLRRADPAVDVLVVDDSSPDGTADLVDKLAVDDPAVHLLRRPGKGGLGTAYRAGFRWGAERGYEAMVEMDADLSHDPSRVPALVAALAGAELVIGSRYVPGGSVVEWNLPRRMLSRWANRYSSLMLGLAVRDLTSGFRAYRSTLLADLPMDGLEADGYGFQIEMAYQAARCGARIVELPIRFVDRAEGKSKMSTRIAVEALVLVTSWGAERLWGELRRRRGPVASRTGS